MIVKLLSIVAAVIGATVLYGWGTDNAMLKSLYTGWVTMKPLTAVCLIFASGIVFYLKETLRHTDKWAGILTAACSMWIAALMGGLLFESLTGISLNIEDIGFKDNPDAIMTTIPGLPSIASIIAFLNVAMLGIFAIFNTTCFNLRKNICANILLFISGLSLLGYLINNPWLYFYFPGKSTAMALHTAIGLGILGTAIRIFKREPQTT